MNGQHSEHFVSPPPLFASQEATQSSYGSYWERFFARLIDMRLSLFLIPIFINLIIYFAQGQTLGYKIMGLTVRAEETPTERPSMKHLLKRSISKVLITFVVTLVVVSLLSLSMRYLIKSPLPEGSFVWLFLFFYLLIGALLALVSMSENKRNKSLGDIVGQTIVIKETTTHGTRIVALILCCISTLCLLLIGYIGGYILLDLGSFYVEEQPYNGRLQTTKKYLQSPLTDAELVTDTTVFISYYFDPYGSFKGYATPGIRLSDSDIEALNELDNDLAKKIEIVEELEDPREVNNRVEDELEEEFPEKVLSDTSDEDNDTLPETDQTAKDAAPAKGNQSAPKASIKHPMRQLSHKEKTEDQEKQESSKSGSSVVAPGELPTVDDILIANERKATSSLRYILELPQIGRVFTHSHSDEDNVVTQVHSLLGDQEIRINNEGLFIKDNITPRTKLSTDGNAKDEVEYMYSRKALLPLLRQSTLEGITTLNGDEVYMFTTKTRDSYPLLITQHLGNEEIDEVLLTFYVDVETLRLVGGTVVVAIGENRFEGILSISYDVSPPKVTTPLGYIKKYIQYIDALFDEFPTFGRLARS